MKKDDALTLLKERAQAVQTITAEVADFRAACLYAVDVTQRQGGTSIAAPGLSGKDLSHLKAACKTGGLKLFTKNLRENIGQISTGLTIADWGIAETATLVMDSTSEDFRIATMLCETHVAILPGSKIVQDAMSLENELTSAMKAAPRYFAFISGASRTADIERVLTIGVHGPQELHLLIVKGTSDDKNAS
ncbi:MAG: LutC/YkgG family protein [Syntrophobacteraceae bacterium]